MLRRFENVDSSVSLDSMSVGFRNGPLPTSLEDLDHLTDLPSMTAARPARPVTTVPTGASVVMSDDARAITAPATPSGVGVAATPSPDARGSSTGGSGTLVMTPTSMSVTISPVSGTITGTRPDVDSHDQSTGAVTAGATDALELARSPLQSPRAGRAASVAVTGITALTPTLLDTPSRAHRPSLPTSPPDASAPLPTRTLSPLTRHVTLPSTPTPPHRSAPLSPGAVLSAPVGFDPYVRSCSDAQPW